MDGNRVADDAGLARYVPDLRAAAQRLTASAHEAEDLVQDCLASAVQSGARNIEVPGAWLHQILRRRWYDLLRRRAVERRFLSEGKPAPDAEADAAGRDLVRRVLETLDADSRRVLELRFFHSKTSVEIGTLLGKPCGTVRSLIFHALRKFEAEFKRLLPQENA